MQRIVIVGGGVGGTLTANLLARELGRQIDRGEVSLTVVDLEGEHVYQPGFMYIAMGNQKPEGLVRSERSLLDKRVRLEVGEVTRIDAEGQLVELAGGERLAYDQLVLASGSRIVPELVPGLAEEAHHFYGVEQAQRLREALDAFKGGKIVIGIAGMPYKCPPAPLEVSFLIESELRERGLREKSEIHFCSPIGRAFTIESVSEMATPILAEKGIELHTFFNVESIDREAKKVIEPGGGGAALRPADPGAAHSRRAVPDRLGAGAGAWRLASDRPKHTLEVGGRSNIHALGDATDLPLSKAGSTAHFEAPIVTERITAAITGREPHAEKVPLHREGDVLLRGGRWQGNAAPVRLRPSA